MQPKNKRRIDASNLLPYLPEDEKMKKKERKVYQGLSLKEAEKRKTDRLVGIVKTDKNESGQQQDL